MVNSFLLQGIDGWDSGQPNEPNLSVSYHITEPAGPRTGGFACPRLTPGMGGRSDRRMENAATGDAP